MGKGSGQREKAEVEAEVVEEAAKRKGEAGDEGKVALRVGIAVVAGKSRAVERGKTEEAGSGERGSGGAVGGRRFWRAG